MTSSRGLKDRSQSKLGQRNASCLYKPPSTTRSTFNAILFPATRSASSEEKRCRSGEQRPRLELANFVAQRRPVAHAVGASNARRQKQRLRPHRGNQPRPSRVPLRSYSQSTRAGPRLHCDRKAGFGDELLGGLISSRQTSGRSVSRGRVETDSTSSIAATKAPLALGGMTQYLRRCG